MTSDPERITRLLRNQDRQQIELLLAEHRARLRKMVAARMDPRLAARVDPSDVVQETMLEAMRMLPEYVLDLSDDNESKLYRDEDLAFLDEQLLQS